MINKNIRMLGYSFNATQNYEPSRLLVQFHLAGFAYYDGLEVMEYIIPGELVNLVLEPDNPHDPDAVAIYLKGFKIGYVPQKNNELLSQLLYFGYEDIFEARIQMINHLATSPANQVRVSVKVRDNRN